MGDLLQPQHLLIILGICVLMFGGRKLPELGKGLGDGLRSFKEGLKGVNDDVKTASDPAHTVTPKPEDTAIKS